MDQALVDRAKSLIDELAQTPRFAGSAEESRARGLCRRELEKAGFTTKEIPFSYSQWPGRWGPPLFALFMTAGIVSFSEFAVRNALSGTSGIWAVYLWGAALGYRYFARGILTFGVSRASATNLEARRGNPKLWLVAHIDSKSQTVPMLLRIVGSILLPVAFIVLAVGIALDLMQLSANLFFYRVAEVIAVFGAIPSVFCFIRNDSPGALDNASGVAAVILAATSATAPPALGVLISSAEELGLAGARSWANSVVAGLVFLNCDTVDDAGGWRCMYSFAEPTRIGIAAEAASARLGLSLRVGRIIPGILADSMAFAERGHSAVTISRGTLRTLARIHTRGDNSTKLTGEGAAQASALLSAMARELS